MLEIVARLDAFGAAERRIVEIDPCFHRGAVFKGYRCPGAGVQAGLRVAGPVAFELVEGAERGKGVGELVNLAGDAAVGRRHGRRVDAKVEERGGDGAATHEGKVLIQTHLPGPVERGHQRPVEENQFGHALDTGPPGRRTPLAETTPGVKGPFTASL